MEIRSPLENDFTLARYRPHEKFLARAFGLSEGLQGIPANTQVHNKLKSILWKNAKRILNLIYKILLKGGKQWNTRPLN